MGRGSDMMSVFVALLLINWSTDTTASHIPYSHTHDVGGSEGWGLGVSYEDWTNGRELAAGDTLVFKYQPGEYNVVPVNGASYRSCKPTASDASKTVWTGNDKFKLKMGANYFICSLPGYCQAGMKLHVNAN
ncbi:basic blue-like protein [Cinnamomum micranthum f. kanehirae]|uniref:Basic blue-like protein n=1 Tax=Cinnamomum micranthum f. kanehirae TaxID=337451 RepID=A0A3S3MX06_9MAGN|nr:basic blue-like protein [Cinnamomum micranthum f. kanehirae]